MTDLEKIESSVELRIGLSKLLHEKLKMGCYHLWDRDGGSTRFYCKQKDCGEEKYINYWQPFPDYRIDLFTPESFLTVFNAVKDREDIRQHFGIMARQQADFWIPADDIGSPEFPLAVLGLLLEQDNEGERLQRILEGEVV